MLFSSPAFLFAFLPLFLAAYFALPVRARNGVVFLFSLLFYFTTSGELTAILVLSVVVNHVLALRLGAAEGTARKVLFAAGVGVNLLPLLYYKYAKFGLAALHDVLAAAHVGTMLPEIDPILPIGISFFTFQAVSYIADIYMGRVRPARRLVDFGMYHACFPQLIAGPIVRYEEVAHEVRLQPTRLDDFYNGGVQFCVGLAKKVILADTMGQVADHAFGLPAGELDNGTAWLGIVAYTLQIYLDFSGYSDMAIGLGRIIGFHYPENFNQPYRACSVTEFWRRWHMTLSRWFRDYVYIPLGGNRGGVGRTAVNLVLVFFLCGLWHGAAYTFVLWGLYHGALLMVERLVRGRAGRVPAALGWVWTIVAVMVGWVLFRAASVSAAWLYLSAMFDVTHVPSLARLAAVMTADKVTYLVCALVVALVPFRRFVAFDGRYDFGVGLGAGSLVLAVLAIVLMSVNGFSPFIYFRF